LLSFLFGPWHYLANLKIWGIAELIGQNFHGPTFLFLRAMGQQKFRAMALVGRMSFCQPTLVSSLPKIKGKSIEKNIGKK
jgi:hypothetical protein